MWKVLDKIYHENEAPGQGVFQGTREECENFVRDQGGFGYEIVPILPDEKECSAPILQLP